ncbi:MAG TPA: hypothetical protein VEW66_00975, partial [Thermomicrobiales bacterium]|nr:hypothetical protein [Thermomicrobiales bacterium]
MEMTAWSSLHTLVRGRNTDGRISRETLRRIGGFAARHRRRIALFVLLSVIGAVLAVATPLLAGQVVNAIVDGDSKSTVIGLAVVIAVIAFA